MFFDGVCNLCNGAVQYVLQRDRDGDMQFCALQSPIAQVILGDDYDPEIGTFVVLEKGRVYKRSAAALRMANYLGGLHTIFLIFYIVPSPIRDWLYDLVATNRYRLFGKREACLLPQPQWIARFIDQPGPN